jgi:putative transposase
MMSGKGRPYEPEPQTAPISGRMTYNALRNGRVSIPGQTYIVTTVCAGRRPMFLDLACARAAIAEMRRLHDAGHVRCLAFVVMPDHVHWLFELAARSRSIR